MNELPRIVRLGDLAAHLDCTTATIAKMVKRRDIPAPIKLGRSRPFWLASELAPVLRGQPSKAA
jgi:predicted DNA-binding transcriptional regulator AlpA